jgi:hypothetical protein
LADRKTRGRYENRNERLKRSVRKKRRDGGPREINWGGMLSGPEAVDLERLLSAARNSDSVMKGTKRSEDGWALKKEERRLVIWS